jgi:hypothetical protein
LPVQKPLGPSSTGVYWRLLTVSDGPGLRRLKPEPDLCFVCSSLDTPLRCQLLNQTETVAVAPSGFIAIESLSTVVDRDPEAFLLEIDAHPDRLFAVTCGVACDLRREESGSIEIDPQILSLGDFSQEPARLRRRRGAGG